MYIILKIKKRTGFTCTEIIEMIRYIFFVLITATWLIISGCNKNITPANGGQTNLAEKDFATFDRYYVEGLKQKMMGDAGEALKFFEQCLRIFPENDAVYYQMAQVLAGTGNTGAAIKYALNAVKYDDKNIWYRMMLSQLYFQEKNVDSAIVWYEKTVKMFPANENIQLTLGNLYIEKGDLDKANNIFDSFDRKYGVNDASTLASIRILMSEKKYEDARIKVEELLKQKPEDIVYNGLLAEILTGKGEKDKALEIYEKLFKISPDDPQVQLSFAGFLASDKKYDELFSLLNSIAVNESIKRDDKVSLFAELSQNKDLINDKENRLMKSLFALEAVYNNDDVIPLIRADVLIKQGKTELAVARLEEMVKTKPDNYFAWEKLMFAYLDLGDFEKLRTRGEECAARFNTSFILKILYANGAMETGKYETAISELDKAEILAAGNKEYRMQVLTLKADTYYRMKDYDKSFAAFEEALKIDRNDVTIMNNYAYYLAEQDTKLKEAEDLSKQVVEREKNNNTFLDTYGWVLYKRGKLGEAARVFESIISSNEKPDAEWFEHYGFILKKQGKCSKAVANWQISIGLDPSKEHLKKEIENCEK